MTTAPRTMLVIVVAACLSLMFVASAYAEAPRVDGAYVPWSQVATMPGQGDSPHGGYTSTTVKCGVCHAVHGAEGELLLRDMASDSCNYCHVGGAGGYTEVYGGMPSQYSGTDYANAHNNYLDGGGTFTGVTCANCHQVHGADSQMTANAYLTTKILVGDKVYDEWEKNYDPIAQAPLSTDDSSTALTKWCAGCHFNDYPYYADGYNQQSHIMTTATAVYGNTSASYAGKVAWKNSTYCSSCHSSGYGTAAWPHFTEGESFLDSASGATATVSGALDPREDGVCLRCHRSGTEGAGLGF